MINVWNQSVIERSKSDIYLQSDTLIYSAPEEV